MINPKKIILCALVLLAGRAFAQEDLSARDPRLNEGHLFSVQITPGNRRLVISLAGRPEMEVGPGQISVFGRTFGPKGEARKLEIKPSGSAFTFGEKLKPGQTIEVEIREKREGGKKETIKLETP